MATFPAKHPVIRAASFKAGFMPVMENGVINESRVAAPVGVHGRKAKSAFNTVFWSVAMFTECRCRNYDQNSIMRECAECGRKTRFICFREL